MARITPIDVIKGISGKYGNNSNDYFATNSSSNKIHLAKFSNPYKGPATEKQLAQREKFATKQAACTAWLNANRPSEKNGMKGTADYQRVQKLKRAFAFSNINQVIYKATSNCQKVPPQRLNRGVVLEVAVARWMLSTIPARLTTPS